MGQTREVARPGEKSCACGAFWVSGLIVRGKAMQDDGRQCYDRHSVACCWAHDADLCDFCEKPANPVELSESSYMPADRVAQRGQS